jgi:uncharacterized protein YndB with AHSA1/START domain
MDDATMTQASYERTAQVAAPAERVYEAITTLDGLAGWWTPLVSGTPAVEGGEIRFEFAGRGEHILMRVATLEPPATVAWHCVTHSSFSAWDDTCVTFTIEKRSLGRCELTLRHLGVAPEWDYFLSSLISYAERGVGTPFSGGERSGRAGR